MQYNGSSVSAAAHDVDDANLLRRRLACSRMNDHGARNDRGQGLEEDFLGTSMIVQTHSWLGSPLN